MTRVTDTGRWVGRDPWERFIDRVTVTESGCWIVNGATNRDGYSPFRVKNEAGLWVTQLAHRFAWEHEHGPLHPDVTLDHECHTFDLSCWDRVTCPHLRCARPGPGHCWPVTWEENRARVEWRRRRVGLLQPAG